MSIAFSRFKDSLVIWKLQSSLIRNVSSIEQRLKLGAAETSPVNSNGERELSKPTV